MKKIMMSSLILGLLSVGAQASGERVYFARCNMNGEAGEKAVELVAKDVNVINLESATHSAEVQFYELDKAKLVGKATIAVWKKGVSGINSGLTAKFALESPYFSEGSVEAYEGFGLFFNKNKSSVQCSFLSCDTKKACLSQI